MRLVAPLGGTVGSLLVMVACNAVSGAPAAAPSAASASASPLTQAASGNAVCDVTTPDPPFLAPSGFPERPPAYYGSAWFGSDALWTMIAINGERWAQLALPRDEAGLGQKSFWWSADRDPDKEPEPAITITGRRLDGGATFKTNGLGTNANADFGPAMLVGVTFPSPGCWEITGHYRDAELSYVVEIID